MLPGQLGWGRRRTAGLSTRFAGDGENEGKELSLLAAGAAETPVADTYRRLTAQGSWRCGSPHFGRHGREGELGTMGGLAAHEPGRGGSLRG